MLLRMQPLELKSHALAARGLFCVVEGIDGSGKSTLSKSLYQMLTDEKQNGRWSFFREPTELDTGRIIRGILADTKRAANLTQQEWLDLFINDRSCNLTKHIDPTLLSGGSVLQERYLYSTAAYQGEDTKGNLTPKEIIDLQMNLNFLEPDVIIYVDLKPKTALQRIASRGEPLDYFEKHSRLETVYRNFDLILPSHTYRVDGNMSMSDLAEHSLAIIKNHKRRDG